MALSIRRRVLLNFGLSESFMNKTYSNLGARDALLLEVGRCLFLWSGIELNLSTFFTALHEDIVQSVENNHALRAAFDAVVSFEVRVAMIDAAVINSNKADQDIKDCWSSFSNKLRKKYKDRNAVAHFGIARRSTPSGQVDGILPFVNFTSAVNKTTKPLLKLEDLVRRRIAFEGLQVRSSAFSQLLLLNTPELLKEAGILEADLRAKIRGPKSQNPKGS